MEEHKEIQATLTLEQKEKSNKLREGNKDEMRRGNRASQDKPQLQKKNMEQKRFHR